MTAFRKEYPAIYVGNVNSKLSKEQLSHVFKPIGSFQLLTHKDGKSKGWGFLCFATTKDANLGRQYLINARLMIRGLTLDVGTVRGWSTTDERLSRTMDRELASATPASAPTIIKSRIAELSHSIFVGNLPGHVSKKDLHNMFSVCGDIIAEFVALNKEGECLGYGFIDFYDEESVYDAVKRFDSTEWRGKIIRVDVGEDVNREVAFPSAPPPAAITAPTNQAPWAAVLPQRGSTSAPAPAIPAPPPAVLAAAARAPPRAAPIAPVVPVVPVVAPAPPARLPGEALDDTIRRITPNLLQMTLAVNAAGGLEFGVGVEEASRRLLGSELLRNAVKEMLRKVRERE